MNSCLLAHAAILMRHTSHFKQAVAGDMGLSGLDTAPGGSRYTGPAPGQGGVGKSGIRKTVDSLKIFGAAVRKPFDNVQADVNAARAKRGMAPMSTFGLSGAKTPLTPKAPTTTPPEQKSNTAAATPPASGTSTPAKPSVVAPLLPKPPAATLHQVTAPAPVLTLAPKDAPAVTSPPPAAPAVADPVIAPIGGPNLGNAQPLGTPTPAVASPMERATPATPVTAPTVAPAVPAAPSDLPEISTSQPSPPVASAAVAAPTPPSAPAPAASPAAAAPTGSKRVEIGPTPEGMELIGMGPGGVPKYAPIEAPAVVTPRPSVAPLRPVTRQSRIQAEAAARLAKTKANIAAQQEARNRPMEADPVGLKLGPKKIPLDQLVAQNKANGIGSM